MTYFNFNDKRGVILLDKGKIEIDVRADQLGKGVRYLVKGGRVSLTIVQDDAGTRPQDIRPV